MRLPPTHLSERASRSARAIVTLAWSLAFAYSLAPFQPFLTVSPANDNVSGGEVGIPNDWWAVSLAVHFFVFAAIGVAERFATEPRDRSRPWSWIPVRGMLFCGLIELGQKFFAGRHAEALDLVVNVVGVTAGYLAAGRVRRWQPLGPTALRHAVRPVLMVVWGVFWSAAVLLPARLVALDSWDAGYPLMIGNESGGGRAWEGELRYLAFYDRALSADEVRRMHPRGSDVEDGPPLEATAGLLAVYDFTRPDRVEIAATGRWKEPASIRAGAAGALSDAMASQGAFSIEASFQTAQVSQTGPARIVSISASPWSRNVMLGQEGQALHFRVRNRLNGGNGDRHQLICPEAVDERPMHIVATYNHGVSTVFRDGTQACPAIDLREPSVLLGLGAGWLSAAVTSALAAISWIAIAGHRATLVRLLLTGYGWLLLALAVSPVLGFRPAASLYIWFGPAVLLFWLALTTRSVMWTRRRDSEGVLRAEPRERRERRGRRESADT